MGSSPCVAAADWAPARSSSGFEGDQEPHPFNALFTAAISSPTVAVPLPLRLASKAGQAANGHCRALFGARWAWRLLPGHAEADARKVNCDLTDLVVVTAHDNFVNRRRRQFPGNRIEGIVIRRHRDVVPRLQTVRFVTVNRAGRRGGAF